MFYLSGRGNLPGNPKTDNEDEFGWYLEDREIIEKKIYENSSQNQRSFKRISGFDHANGTSSLNSVITIFHCNDQKDRSGKNRYPEKCENDNSDAIEMGEIPSNSYKRSNENHGIDLEMIENDADHSVFSSTIISNGETENLANDDDEEKLNDDPRGICYTPERLVRSQKYRILTPSPRYLNLPTNQSNQIENITPRRYTGHRRKIGDLIDSKQFGASHLEALLDPGASEIRLPVTCNRRRINLRDRLALKKNINADSSSELIDPLDIANRDSPEAFETPDLASSRSSYERLASSWEERDKIIRRSSQDDTSGIHSNDWSNDTPSDIQTPACLCDELASASRSFVKITESRSRTTAINEVVSILESLEKDPDRAALLLEEDRFCDITSGHDHLTRLALAIEPDGAVPSVKGDPENIVNELRHKVEKLQETTRNILRDIVVLREDFECNESKIDDLTEATIALRRDTNEMRYLDDLLNLLDGELERISRRNWPFIFGHNRAEDMNLVV